MRKNTVITHNYRLYIMFYAVFAEIIRFTLRSLAVLLHKIRKKLRAKKSSFSVADVSYEFFFAVAAAARGIL